MNIKRTYIPAVLAFAFSIAATQGFVVFNIANMGGATIQFNGTASSFQFMPSSGSQWSITGEGGGTGSAMSLQGFFAGGPWSYGGITINGIVQEANVTPSPATLSIYDGVSQYATASIDWGKVSTVLGAGSLNAIGTVNLSSLSYSGTNPDLVSFFSAPAGVLVLTFQFDPAMTLSQLTAGSGPYNTSYSGSLTAVPEPTSLCIFGLGLALLGGRAFFKR